MHDALLPIYYIDLFFMFFSPAELDVIPNPVLYLLKTITFGVIERTDLIFLSFWVFVILATLSNYLYFLCKWCVQYAEEKKITKNMSTILPF
ncbi:hypothetical protein BsIDN1_63740 [Bacillus safensis]|uniref:Uncharacterized protein n=1 Tax=Bacillus safensis TaxID=561879 RepID=A0A5S9MM74_BACIA|nr:hypothetical protein BsIDN1_63740 [Bacillus safensis]